MDYKTNEQLAPERKLNDLIENGIIIVNKQKGVTSRVVVDQIKKILKCRKAGHCGTLDPNVCGVLVITLNNATKISSLITKRGKEYICIMRLHKKVDFDKIKTIFEKFIGCINQLPPVKSSVKREWRKRTVHKLKIIEIENKFILFFASVEAGFYIRKLCSDIGDAIGCGANMVKLLRIKAGDFSICQSHNVLEIQQAYQNYKKTKDEKYLRKIILPMEYGLENIRKIIVKNKAIKSLCNGVPLFPNGVENCEKNIKKNDLIALLSKNKELIAIARSHIDSNSNFKEKKIIAVIERVLKKNKIKNNG